MNMQTNDTPESKNTPKESNNAYTLWTNTMKDAKFQGKTPSTSNEQSDNGETKRIKSIKRMSETIQKIKDTESERSSETLSYLRTELICDDDHIGNQRINIINKPYKDNLEFNFKLKSPDNLLYSLTNSIPFNDKIIRNGTALKQGNFVYDAYWHAPYKLCDAYVLEKKRYNNNDSKPISKRTAMSRSNGLDKSRNP